MEDSSVGVIYDLLHLLYECVRHAPLDFMLAAKCILITNATFLLFVHFF